MASHISNSFYFFIILVMVLAGEGKECRQTPGTCEFLSKFGGCDHYCNYLFVNGKGYCNLGQCDCVYECGSERSCRGILGPCSPQCDSQCAAKFSYGRGTCDPNNMCSCIYKCH